MNKEITSFPAGSGKNDRSFLPVQIDEHRHIVVPPLRGGFIKADGCEFGEIESGQIDGDIVGDDTPQFLVLNPDNPGSSQHRHLPHQGQGHLFEEQRELAALSCPGNLYSLDAMVLAADAGHRGGDIAMVLEEIEMAPGHLFEIVRFAEGAAFRTGEGSSSIRAERDTQFMGRVFSAQGLSANLPGCFDAKS